ncbi:MAG: type II toxin-antitoxin system VapC family toxin [Gammaproteobacteria bacterium]|nr:type II toxin-antitoxin system VapC family toxin [Gammaproteobacteria bacterium]
MPRRARELILTPANQLVVSAASVWEIAIKHGLGRGDMPVSGEDALAYFVQAGYSLLSISPQHGAAVEGLPMHHHDPFDRLLIAQALTEPLCLLTHDSMVAKYSNTVILV